MSLLVYQLNSITGAYVETTYLYIAQQLTSTVANTGRKPIKFVPSSYTSPWKISYSLDSGGTWTDIATGITGTEYIWTPSDTDYNTILNGSPSYDARNIEFKVTDDLAVEQTLSCSIFKSSLVTSGIKPNHTLTECANSDESSQIVHANHGDPIYYRDAVVIEAAEAWYSEANLFDIYIERLSVPGVYVRIINNNYPKALSATWIFDSMNAEGTGAPLSNLYGSEEILRVHFISQGVHAGNHAYGSWFAYTENYEIETMDADVLGKYAPRTDMFSRIGVEKAIYLDEAPAIAQFEAGEGIVITQRNRFGQRTSETGGIEADDSGIIDYKKAYNLVIQSKVTELPENSRHLSDWFEVVEGSTPRADGTTDDGVNWITGTYCMGSAFYYDINHGWDLQGIHQGNFRLDVYNVLGSNSFSKPTSEIIPFWESISKDTIRVYVVIKEDANYQPAETKDNVNITEEKSRWFFYNLTEIIPDIPTVDCEILTENIGQTSITADGEVIYIGGDAVTERGFVWSATNNVPTKGGIGCSHITVGKGRGEYSGLITPLIADTTYYIRAYAINSYGIGYSAILIKDTLA